MVTNMYNCWNWIVDSLLTEPVTPHSTFICFGCNDYAHVLLLIAFGLEGFMWCYVYSVTGWGVRPSMTVSLSLASVLSTQSLTSESSVLPSPALPLSASCCSCVILHSCIWLDLGLTETCNYTAIVLKLSLGLTAAEAQPWWRLRVQVLCWRVSWEPAR